MSVDEIKKGLNELLNVGIVEEKSFKLLIQATIDYINNSEYYFNETNVDIDNVMRANVRLLRKLKRVRYEVSKEFKERMKKEFNPETNNFSLEYILQTLNEQFKIVKNGGIYE